MSTIPHPSKRNVVRTVTELTERLSGRDVYTKAMVRKWITEEVTVLGDLRTYQLAWYLSARIVQDNPNVANFINHLL